MMQNNTMTTMWLLFFGLAAVMQLAACDTAGKEEMIAKKWVIEDMELGMEVPDEQKKMVDQIVEQAKKNSLYHFKADGTYDIQGTGEMDKGSWKLSEDGNELITVKDGTEKEKKIEIRELSNNKLVLHNEDNRGSMTMTLVPDKD